MHTTELNVTGMLYKKARKKLCNSEQRKFPETNVKKKKKKKEPHATVSCHDHGDSLNTKK